MANGTYTIASVMNESLVLDVTGYSKDDCANIQTFNDCNTSNQKWNVTYLGNGYYSIISVGSGKSLDAVGTAGADCTNVQQFTYWNTNNQHWIIQDAGDGSYYIINQTGQANAECLDVAGFYNKPCGNVQLFRCNKTSNQKWKLISEKSVSDGTYTLSSKQNVNLVLDVAGYSFEDGTNVQTFSDSGTSNQKWQVTYLGNGYYRITSAPSNKALDACGFDGNPGTNVQEYTDYGTINQKWTIRDTGDGDGSYYIVSGTGSNECLDIAGFYNQPGGNVQIFPYCKTSNQKWFLNTTSYSDTDVTISDGYYYLSSQMNDNLVVDVTGYSMDDYANAQIYGNSRTGNQLFKVTAVGDDAYELECVGSKKCLDAAGTDDGSNVQQFTYWGNANQKWVLKGAENGYCYLASAADTGKCLDVAGRYNGPGGNLQLFSYNSTSNQKWKLTKVDLQNEFQLISDTQFMEDGHEPAFLSNALKEIKTLSPNSAGIAVVGDETEHGSSFEYQTFRNTVSSSGWSMSQLTCTMGNHEIYTGDFWTQVNRFCDSLNAGWVFYSRNIGNQSFIMLGPDVATESWCAAQISDTQLNWLDQQLSANQAAGRTSYVCVHWPLPNTVAGASSWSWSQEDTNRILNCDEVRSVLDRYSNVVVCSGHSHVVLDTYRANSWTPMYVGTAAISYLADLHDNEYAGSQGWFAYAFDDRVVFVGRDFYNHSWVCQSTFVK